LSNYSGRTFPNIESHSQLRVGAYDTGAPSDVASTTCSINVLRNENEPIFQEEPYEVNLYESTPVGTSIYRVTATDEDGVSKQMENREIYLLCGTI